MYNESILVVKRNTFFNSEEWQGILDVDYNKYINIINKNKEFISREHAETNFNYKQIIPYLVFAFQDKLFLMQRKSTSSEQRLSNKFSLGIGGHIREEDITNDSIIDWSKREFAEEIDYTGNFQIKPIGIINDDSNDVGKVHIGFVFLLIGDSNNIKVRSELKSGNLYTHQECEKYFNNMESWSQLVFLHLKKTLHKN